MPPLLPPPPNPLCSMLEICAIFFRFEKMISGMYLGELVRIVCMDLVDKKLLFKGQVSEKFRTKDSFPAEFVSWVERYLTRGPVIIYYWSPLPPS